MTTDQFKQKLALYIDSSGLSDSEIARRLDVNRVSVGKWRKTGQISKENLSKLCKELGVSEQEFFYSSTSDLPHRKLTIIQEVLLLESRDMMIIEDIENILRQIKG
ncbi:MULTISPECIES: helix-turn-helix transcriptional regulator [Vibrio]|uniref:HTH cro/C1-type domain-containing protein n=2 Tax=Vibrio cyclitrophicus TaxID=47951 RepID=A0A7Z1S091_9VIBR|nr:MULTISPECIES: helix-turn-helix transcriptional regulator [Vibrio]MCF7507191.1 helix-turn-helix domain-containing protein [Vibrio sp. L3-7]PMK74291.1 hypothetical protein BCT92_07215 [Vibrio sp. 10N.261.52.E5]PMP17133.1 hypothetical protein BCS91_26020 [Vibrio cyclitrophicus]PMP26139.1 hypothetical protein BCS90_23655 [Vibrio cyclitrophicus]TKF84813.1 helix-turn-helix transcriptional regulator [Vibrio sp. F13]